MRQIDPTSLEILTSAEFMSRVYADATDSDPTLRRARHDARGRIRRRARREAIARKCSFLIE